MTQLALFADPTLPEGFRYQPGLITAALESGLVARFAELPFKPFEFQGFLGKRRVTSFGWRYDFNEQAMQRAAPLPEWLAEVRDLAAAFADLHPSKLAHAMVTEYEPGAPIGWHRDRPQFEDVIGISLLSPCTFRFRRKQGAGWQRASIVAEPRSAYLLRGPARTEWQHSIPPVEALRYSITFRTLR
jgi:alkylated DNA repair dioxygenase AlkB